MQVMACSFCKGNLEKKKKWAAQTKYYCVDGLEELAYGAGKRSVEIS